MSRVGKLPVKPAAKQHHRTAVGINKKTLEPFMVTVSRGSSLPPLGAVEDHFLASFRGEFPGVQMIGPVIFNDKIMGATSPLVRGKRAHTAVGIFPNGDVAVGHYMTSNHWEAMREFADSLKRVLPSLKGAHLATVFEGKRWPASPKSVYRVAQLP